MTAKLSQELLAILDPVEDDTLAAVEYAGLLVELTQPGHHAENALKGIHRLAYEIKDHAERIKEQWDLARQFAIRLASEGGAS